MLKHQENCLIPKLKVKLNIKHNRASRRAAQKRSPKQKKGGYKKFNQRTFDKLTKAYAEHPDIKPLKYMLDGNVIGWCDYTVNMWLGCSEVSEACRNCYSRHLMTKIMKSSFKDYWGRNPKAESRYYLGEANWQDKVVKKDEQARKLGINIKFFVNDMSDVFEDSQWVKEEWRQELWEHIGRTTNSTFQLLTKRPENMAKYWPSVPKNVRDKCWVGVTIESQKRMWERLHILNEIEAPIRFVSAEPLQEEIDFHFDRFKNIDWVITGGEQACATNVVEADPRWYRSIKNQCLVHDVEYYHKQNTSKGKVTGKSLDGREYCSVPTEMAA